MVFQDPYSSLNPHLSVGEIIAEPLIVQKIPDRRNRVQALLSSVNLDPAAGVRFAMEFSGGQRQRIGIARALALEPDAIVLDKPVSALDVSIQASVLNLLRDLQRKRNMSYLLIAHDLAVVRQIADDLIVMYLGTIVEQGSVDLVYGHPAHPYTTALMSAVPIPDPSRERQRRQIYRRVRFQAPLIHPRAADFARGVGRRTHAVPKRCQCCTWWRPVTMSPAITRRTARGWRQLRLPSRPGHGNQPRTLQEHYKEKGDWTGINANVTVVLGNRL